jgi:hydroxyacyl-ACP dehydratase HTD2-like protein with hotdog domain
MLKRKLPSQIDYVDPMRELQLHATIRDLFPRKWEPVFASKSFSSSKTPPNKHPASVGDHLVYFNPIPPTNTLLPDGTDTLHSPGGPFVRRMWAGGSLRVNRSLYFDTDGGWGQLQSCACVERIKNVRLHGEGATAKIFVTIERRFARKDELVRSMRRERTSESSEVVEHFQAQVDLDGWGDAFLKEERNLVFMRERSTAELEDIKAGTTTPTRYLASPGIPEFSHALTPSSATLFRFSALTFNAHAIHLDRDFARNVEGHRNLLVHGPLTLMLMVKLMAGHLKEQPGAPQVVQSIEYRNLAPLYCDESLRLCGREKIGLRTEEGSIYDIWVEGPTGGMAVKGTVRTACVPKQEEKVQGT